MSNFSDAFSRWRAMGMPHGVRVGPAMNDICSDIVVIDMWLAGDAMRVSQGDPPRPLFTDIEAAIDQAESSIHALRNVTELAEDQFEMTEKYIEYLEVMRTLHRAIDEVRQEHGQT